MTSVGDIAAALDAFAPRHLAEDWDNVGLLVGDPSATVRTVGVGYDLTAALLDEAIERRAEALVLFHPPIFEPLPRLRADEPRSGLIWRACRAGLSLLVTHTALDNARPGTSDFLAEALGLAVTGVIRPRVGGEVRVVVFCPPNCVDQVAAAMAEAGAGRIGDYAECSFRIPGTGTFRPLAGAQPAVGEVGQFEQVDEVRLEMLAPARAVGAVVAAAQAAHPYEEVAYDLLPLLNNLSGVGLGRLGELPEPVTLEAFAARVGEVTESRHLRWVGEPTRLVRSVAVLGGSGASLLEEAAACGVDAYVTGDLKHHDALLGERLGMGLIDPGHWATERLVLAPTVAALRSRLADVTVYQSELESEPFRPR
ncbi:MAG: Nif3-like dinuclear metal center hexameric protein [Armatimonadetes bacterium]|nr:Nif3-like dinuclear metal center hexameric protein [Armatimonadota bacterium]